MTTYSKLSHSGYCLCFIFVFVIIFLFFVVFCLKNDFFDIEQTSHLLAVFVCVRIAH